LRSLFILVLTVPMCVAGVTLTVPIESGIKLFKKGQLRCLTVCANIVPVNDSQERCISGQVPFAWHRPRQCRGGLLVSVTLLAEDDLQPNAARFEVCGGRGWNRMPGNLSTSRRCVPQIPISAKVVHYSCKTTLRREVLICSPPLYLMNPNFLNLFMKKLTRGRVVPIISASVSCDTSWSTPWGWSSWP
jgi:hypothetical protein